MKVIFLTPTMQISQQGKKNGDIGMLQSYNIFKNS